MLKYTSQNHFLCITLLSVGVISSVMSSSWLSLWASMEISTLAFTPIFFDEKTKNSECMIKYFLIQSYPSLILLFCLILSSSMFFYLKLLITLALSLKLGAAPMHMWVVQISEYLDWFQLWNLLIYTKIPSLIGMSIIPSQLSSTAFSAISLIIGAMGGINQSKINMMIVYSSVNHLGWLLSGFPNTPYSSMFYFLSYTLILTSLMVWLNNNELSSVNSNQNNKTNLFPLMISLLSLSGFPPLMGFFPKMTMISNLLLMDSKILIPIMILTSLWSSFFYMKMSFQSMIHSMNSSYCKTSGNTPIYLFNIITVPLLLTPL